MSDDQIRQLKYEQAYESALSQPAEAEEPARADEVVFDTLLVVNNQLRTENKRLRTQLAEAGKAWHQTEIDERGVARGGLAMPCKLCRERVKDWDGSDPTCAFYDGDFAENWNCATVSAIRELCYEGQELPDGVQYRYCDDQKYATVDVSEVEVNDEHIGYCLWVCWYKCRGATDAMWLLNSEGPPRQPTEAECLAIIEHYKAKS